MSSPEVCGPARGLTTIRRNIVSPISACLWEGRRIKRKHVFFFIGWPRTEQAETAGPRPAGHASSALQFAHRRSIRRLARKRRCYALKIRRFFLMHYVYVLRSTSDDDLYIGYSANLRKRLQQHAQGESFATSYRGPWKLIYYEAYLERDDALGRERYLKSGSGRKFLKTQLSTT